MMENTARQFTEYAEPIPAPKPHVEPVPVPVAAPRHIAFSPLERLLSVCCGLAAVAMSLLFLTAQDTLASANRQYQDLQTQIVAENSHVDDYKQTIGELTNSARLSTFAKAHGLTVIEGNIKRVNQ
jgi:cell division protein FtsL